MTRHAPDSIKPGTAGPCPHDPGTLERAVAALVPFVHAWHLPLNPEELEEMAWAVLTHASSDRPLEHIVDDVNAQLGAYDQTNRRQREAITGRPLTR